MLKGFPFAVIVGKKSLSKVLKQKNKTGENNEESKQTEKRLIESEEKSRILFENISDVIAIAKPVLRHRIIKNFKAEAAGISTDYIVDQILTTVKDALSK